MRCISNVLAQPQPHVRSAFDTQICYGHVMRRGTIQRHHAVRFYENDESLFKTVGGFLSEGLVSGEPAIIIATGPHQRGILDELRARLIDVGKARRIGDLVIQDAEETLALSMTSTGPSANFFEQDVGRVIDQVVCGHRESVVRAYGEMVDILWREGQTDEAVQVEMLWNQLATKYAFSLLCGYAMGHFYKQADEMQRVCAQHTAVVDPESNIIPLRPPLPA